MKKNTSFRTALLAGLLGGWGLAASAANIEIVNFDAPGEGFNDPTPAAPIGGNAGTTLGEQRLIAYRRALDLWGSVLKSDVTIYVIGTFGPFDPDDCDAGGGVLARAGALQIFANFPNAPKEDVWYGVALANSLAGEDLAPGNPEEDIYAADIVAQFNGGIGTPNCIAGSTWYYGLDNNAPAGTIDFLNTFMHEVAHGLGFANFISEANGLPPAYPDFPYPDIYMSNTLDTSINQTWDQLTPAEIVASATRTGNVVWAGRQVTKSVPKFLAPFETLRVIDPVEKEFATGTASFGPPASAENFSGEVALGVSADQTTTGCTAITSDVAGKIALVDRGVCPFVQKAAVAQAAGAKAVLIANTTAGVQGMSGTDPTVTIPALLISNSDGQLLKDNLPATVEWFVDPTRRAGADSRNRALLYAPPVVALGSSISHFDISANPNLLMEPAITSTLKAGTNVDLTAQLFKDIGWPIETLKIGNCDTRVPNVTPVGDIISTQIEQCAADTDRRGEFVACSAHVALGLKFQRFIDVKDFARIAVCAATVRNP